MRNYTGYWVALVLCFLVAGCASTPQKPFNHAAYQDVKTIGLLTPQLPEQLSVGMAVPPGTNFGLIGALVDAGVRSSKETDFNAAMQTKNFNMQSMIVDALKNALEQDGYVVTLVPITRGKTKDGFLDKYPSSGDPVDAYLDINSSYVGYMAAGATTPYRPTIALGCKLVASKDSSVLMQDQVLYNPFGDQPKAVTLTPDTKYEFAEFSNLTADPDKAAEGINVAAVAAAQAVGKLLH